VSRGRVALCLAFALAASVDSRASSDADVAREPCLAPAVPTFEAGLTRAELELALAANGSEPLLDLLERAEVRAGSLGLDVDDELDRDAERAARELWPRLTAARAWYRPSVRERGLRVARCGEPGAELRLWEGSSRATLEQRHAAWAIAGAALLESSEPRALLQRLRARSADEESAIALVVARESSGAGASELIRRAQRLVAEARRFDRPIDAWVSMLARAEERDLASPLALGEREVAIVPRLSALARLPEFTSEIDALRGPNSRWLRRPSAL
jgi:hypothetical protein